MCISLYVYTSGRREDALGGLVGMGSRNVEIVLRTNPSFKAQVLPQRRQDSRDMAENGVYMVAELVTSSEHWHAVVGPVCVLSPFTGAWWHRGGLHHR